MASAERSPQEYREPMSPSLAHDKADHILRVFGKEYISSTTNGDIRIRSLSLRPSSQLNGDPAKILRLTSWEKMDDFSTNPSNVTLTTLEPISDINTHDTKHIKIINRKGEVELKPFQVTEMIGLSTDGPSIKAEQIWYPYSMTTEISAAKLRKVDQLLDYVHTYMSMINNSTPPSGR